VGTWFGAWDAHHVRWVNLKELPVVVEGGIKRFGGLYPDTTQYIHARRSGKLVRQKFQASLQRQRVRIGGYDSGDSNAQTYISDVDAAHVYCGQEELLEEGPAYPDPMSTWT
jgi:hypothetical protein